MALVKMLLRFHQHHFVMNYIETEYKSLTRESDSPLDTLLFISLL